MSGEDTKVVVLASGRKPKNFENKIAVGKYNKVTYLAIFDSMSQALTGLHTLLETENIELMPHTAKDRWIEVRIPEKMQVRFLEILIIPLDTMLLEHKRSFIEIPRR